MSEQEDAVSLRDEAITHLKKADDLLRQAGIREDLAVLASEQQDQGRAHEAQQKGDEDDAQEAPVEPGVG